MESTGSASPDYFIDGVANLSFTAGAFRFDLVSLMPDNNPAGDGQERKQTLKKCAHVVMTVQGYAQMINAMQDLLDKVKEQDALKSE